MSISVDAKIISTTFAGLREFNIIVFNFNAKSMRYKAGGFKGFCDMVIISEKTGIHFIEVKLDSTKDRFKPAQKVLGTLMTKLTNKSEYINYWVIHNLDEAYAVFDVCLNGINNIGDQIDGKIK